MWYSFHGIMSILVEPDAVATGGIKVDFGNNWLEAARRVLVLPTKAESHKEDATLALGRVLQQEASSRFEDAIGGI